MVRSGRKPWVRSLASLLLGAVALLVFAPEASASGCHAPDRPTFGLSDFFAAEARLDADHEAPPAFSPIPCDGETPATVSIFAATPPALSTLSDSIDPPAAGRSLALPVDLLTPQADTAPLVRPPRIFTV